MIKSKNKRKFMVLSLLSLFLLGIFVVPASAAYQKFDCTWADVQCKGVKFTSYGTATAYSDYIYAIQGQSLAVSNVSDGPFNLVTRLVDSSGNVYTPEIPYTQTVYANVPNNGYYRVKVTCKDTSTSERCLGQGSVSE